MSLGVNKVSFAGVQNVKNAQKADLTSKSEKYYMYNQNVEGDIVDFKSKVLSDTEKKELILKARTKAAGYSCFGGIFSVLYYGLRSNDKVARKFDLDVNKDKDLIKKIKKEQLLWTLPSIIPGLGMIGGIAAYIYNKNCDAVDIDL